MQYASRYQVKATDTFVAFHYALVEDEINMVKLKTDPYASLFKVEMIVSFVKRHAILQAHIKANAPLATFIVSGQLFNGEIEALFDAAHGNVLFCSQLQTFLEDALTMLPPNSHY